MRRLWIAVIAGLVLAGGQVLAQSPTPAPPKPANGTASGGAKAAKSKDSSYPNYPTLSPGEIQATPEMWFYEQAMRQYLDPNLAVRRSAEFRAEQRQARLESRKWYGLSNQRPTANIDPFHSEYSPHWSSGSFYPYRWIGAGEPWVVIRPGEGRVY